MLSMNEKDLRTLVFWILEAEISTYPVQTFDRLLAL